MAFSFRLSKLSSDAPPIGTSALKDNTVRQGTPRLRYDLETCKVNTMRLSRVAVLCVVALALCGAVIAEQAGMYPVDRECSRPQAPSCLNTSRLRIRVVPPLPRAFSSNVHDTRPDDNLT